MGQKMEMNKENEKDKICCYISTESCIHSRRCFMTGEYCSKQPNIQRERKKLHDNKNGKKKFKIRAFVIMNFSDMSDVVYKWRIRPFIESLSKYLYVEEEKLYCSSIEEDVKENDKRHPVTEIEVVRSDSDPASNYVICSRICQQMQIADLVIVDVSNQNANVFYEFGMAAALGKMILPICYSESFYKRVVPKSLNDEESIWITQVNKEQNMGDEEEKDIEHHIGFFPWRKELFEYYGIRYKTSESSTKYLTYRNAVNPKNGFSDIQYSRFPYHEVLKLEGNETRNIGQKIYEELRDTYNNKYEKANTLVVYTMDAFLNEEEAGLCIVNFYNKIVLKMKEEKCFCGERVGVLVQGNVIPENEKDAKEELDIDYSVGEIIQIGTNQATYLAAEEKIKSNDKWTDSLGNDSGVDIKAEWSSSQKKGIERFVKKHITNRAMRVYPNNPVFVDRMKNLLHKDLIKKSAEGDFYLYYVMLRTLRYTNEIVVDISNNCLQSLFWLGAAHGSDIYAVTVMHEKTDMEKQREEKEHGKENRYIFDVAGLWMAILRKNDTEGFYLQLAAAQSGIERHSKLMLPNTKYYNGKLKEYLFSFDGISDSEHINLENLNAQKEEEEQAILESYYRDRFWTPMLRYNQLSIYLSHRNDKGTEGTKEEPRLCMSKWDFLAVSVLSHYLSKRKIIGEYSLVSIAKDEKRAKAKYLNFICIGSEVKPLEKSLSSDIYEKISDVKLPFKDISEINIIHEKVPPLDDLICDEQKESKSFKGFCRHGNEAMGIFVHQPNTKTCAKCDKLNEEFKGDINIYYDKEKIRKETVCQFMSGRHIEIAQLILWRDDFVDSEQTNYFRVGIIGCSGPATSALSVLFVDEEEIENQLMGNGAEDEKAKWKNGNLLCDLQCLVRKKFMDIFLKQLNEMIMNVTEFTDKPENEEEQKKKYCALVRYAVVFYLKTVLYRYFFPFLSETDIERIYNGMYTFINSMKAARISPFAFNYHATGEQSVVKDTIIDKIVDEIPELLRNNLKSFRGIEAFYKVEVSHFLYDPEVEKDTRRVEKIELLKRDENPQINYLFI